MVKTSEGSIALCQVSTKSGQVQGIERARLSGAVSAAQLREWIAANV
jgi:hypothetical protein